MYQMQSTVQIKVTSLLHNFSSFAALHSSAAAWALLLQKLWKQPVHPTAEWHSFQPKFLDGPVLCKKAAVLESI